jgi:hypothetical protein
MERDDDCLSAGKNSSDGCYEMVCLLSWALWRQGQPPTELPSMLEDRRFRSAQAVEYILEWAEQFPERIQWR